MKMVIVWLCAVLLAGCSAGPRTVPLSTLETQAHLQDQRRLPLDFAKIQMALFKHQRLCGSAPVFAVVPDHPSYATVTLKKFKGAGWANTILVDMTLLENLTVRAKTYAYYPDQHDSIEQIFSAITHPTVCPGQKKGGAQPSGTPSS